MPVARRNPAAASIGGDRFEARRPCLPLAWPPIGRRAHLGVGQLVEQGRVGTEDAGVRAVPLVGAAGEDVAAEGVHVDRLVRSEVHGVDEHACTGVVGGGDDRREVGHRPDEVRGAGQRHPARALVDEGDDVARVEQAAAAVERGEDVLGACLVARDPPRRHVGIVVEARPHDAIAGLQRCRDGPTERQRQRRHVGAEHDPVRRPAEQRGDGPPGLLEQSVALVGSRERPAAVGVVPARCPCRHGVDRRVDHLGARRPVEPGPPVTDPWEPSPHRRVTHAGELAEHLHPSTRCRPSTW